jgi:hypothetical protein
VTQWWALVAPDGRAQLRTTQHHGRKPKKHGGCAGEICKGMRVHRLERLPGEGERVSWERGEIVFTPPPGIFVEIKAEAARRIELIAPAWRQTNALLALIDDAGDVGARALFGQIKAVRDWSDALEAQAMAATGPAAVAALRAQLIKKES